MAEKNFMVAGTEIGEYIDKRNQCLTKIANIISQACITRAHSGKGAGNIQNDVANLIKSLPNDDKVTVLMQVTENLTSKISNNSVTGKVQGSGKRNPMNDIFANRDF